MRIVICVSACAMLALLSAQPDQLTSGWHYVAGRTGERLFAPASDMPSSTVAVELPHRALLPNTAMWYARTLVLPQDGALEVDADDGAQVFVDGVRWTSDRRTFFSDTPLAAGTRAVVIRVLNNAMQGGLRRVTIAGRPAPADRALLPRPGPGFGAVESRAFQTWMPAPSEPCDFTLWADSQGGWTTFAALVEQMRQRAHHFSAGVGDLVNDGSDPQGWRHFVATLAPLAARVPVVPIAGNHDYDGYYNDLRARWYLETFARETTWFAWSCGPARFAALDLNTEFPIGVSNGSPQHVWLQREVRSAAWRSAAWRVLLVHQPPFSRSWEGYDGDEAVRTIVGGLVREHGLQLVVAGHSHAYEYLTRQMAGRPVHVLITGGAGGSLEAPRSEPIAGPDRVILAHHFVRARATRTALTWDVVDGKGQVLERGRLGR